MRILDLFCGGGGASVGYSRAGWLGWNSLKESIPPIYTEHLGKQIKEQL